MNKRPAGIAIGAFFWMSLVSVEGTYALEANQSIKDIDEVARVIWEKREGINISLYGEPNHPLCVYIPSRPEPDAKSIAKHPMARHFDFISDKPLTKDREIQLRQLDALNKAGLLEKFSTVANIGGEMKKVIRYRLTEKGWSASSYSKRYPACFVYGIPRYLGTAGTPAMIGKHGGGGIYEVRGKVGLGSEAELAPWAKSLEIRSVFQEINEKIGGQEHSVRIYRDGNEWFDADDILNGRARKKNPRSISRELEQEKSDALKRAHENSELAAPTIDEIQESLLEKFGDPGPSACLHLPSSGKLPVDKTFYRFNPDRSQDYAVAIFTNKDRTPYDRVSRKTIPYLNMLERLGILTKHAESNVPGEGREKGKLFDALIFELTPQYKNRIDPRHRDCFPLGKPTVEIVDIQVGKIVNIQLGDGQYGGSFLSDLNFRFKLRVMYKNPPAWMNDPMLMSNWSELKGVIERGWACDGEFSFDRKTRKTGSGNGSCRWAFDSYYDNY
ncbi:MAG: hypothetical protein LBQ62_05690 [Candidatus Accumulibacter sp.]|nr:hypothetical protein [Accumulibacter sp.]